MSSVRLFTCADQKDWQAYLPATTSIFGSVEYANISEQHTSYPSQLFVIASDDAWIAYPFFLRPIDALPFADQVSSAKWDILTPEYTGPIAYGRIDSSLARCFFDEFSAFCCDEGIVTEVAHLHPWHSQLEALDQTQVTFNREIVYVDVTLAEAEMWNKSFSYMCRKNINRSRQEQVRVFTAQTLDHVREFYRIYVQTMDRRSARSNYYFPFEYFAAFFEQVPEHARFVLAEYKDQIVASTLYLHDDQDVYSYLGGADHAFQLARPTNAVIHETIGWARAQGKRRLILGGGYKPDDGIFRFKASFSPLRATFNLYKRIHAYDQYNSLASAWAQFYHQDLDKDSYFPLYRIVPESN